MIIKEDSRDWPLEKQIRFEKIPVIDAHQLILKKGEVVHFTSKAQVYETKIVKQTHRGYAGTRIKIGAFPLYFGGSTPYTTKSELTSKVGEGTLYFTDTRIVFTGQTLNLSIWIQRINSITEYSDAVQIFFEGKDGTKTFMLEDPRIAIVTLNAIIKTNISEEPPWVEAISAANYKDIQTMILRGFDVNSKTAQGITPLILASVVGRKQIVRLLIENGADLQSDGQKSLKAALHCGNISVYRLLRKTGIKEDDQTDFDITSFSPYPVESEKFIPYNSPSSMNPCPRLGCEGSLKNDGNCDTCGFTAVFSPNFKGRYDELKETVKEATQSAQTHPSTWPMELMIRLIETKMNIVRKGFEALDQGILKRRLRILSEHDALEWLKLAQERLSKIIYDEYTKMFAKFNAAWGDTSLEPKDIKRILTGANAVAELAESSLHWEIDMTYTDVPEDFSKYKMKLQGTSRGVFSIIDKILKSCREWITWDHTKLYRFEIGEKDFSTLNQYSDAVEELKTVVKKLSPKKEDPNAAAGCVTMIVFILILFFIVRACV